MEKRSRVSVCYDDMHKLEIPCTNICPEDKYSRICSLKTQALKATSKLQSFVKIAVLTIFKLRLFRLNSLNKFQLLGTIVIVTLFLNAFGFIPLGHSENRNSKGVPAIIPGDQLPAILCEELRPDTRNSQRISLQELFLKQFGQIKLFMHLSFPWADTGPNEGASNDDKLLQWEDETRGDTGNTDDVKSKVNIKDCTPRILQEGIGQGNNDSGISSVQAAGSDIVSPIKYRRNKEECWSRIEGNQYFDRVSPGYKPSPDLQKRLSQYAKYHESCTKAVKNWTAVVLGEELPKIKSEENSSRKLCKFLLHHSSNLEFGSRMESLVASFSYALITNRVLLMGDWSLSVMTCEPFVGSSWFIPWNVFDFAQNASKSVRLADISEGSLNESSFVGKSTTEKKRIPALWLDLSENWSDRDQGFYCTTAQENLERVTWLTFYTDQYFVPGLFMVSNYKKQLESLFPGREPFTHLGRYLLLPNNHLWERITRVYSLYFQGANETVGIQVEKSAESTSLTQKLILDCLTHVSEAVAPPIEPKQWSEWMVWGNIPPNSEGLSVDTVIENRNPSKTLVFVYSRERRYTDYLRAIYTEGVAVDGSLVDVQTIYPSGSEGDQFAQEQRLLTNIFLLSFCKTLLTTRLSSEGYIAAGLSSRAPYIMKITEEGNKKMVEGLTERNEGPVCERSYSSEPCFFFPPHNRQCKTEDGGEQTIKGKLPSLSSCQEFASGFRLINPLGPHSVELKETLDTLTRKTDTYE